MTVCALSQSVCEYQQAETPTVAGNISKEVLSTLAGVFLLGANKMQSPTSQVCSGDKKKKIVVEFDNGCGRKAYWDCGRCYPIVTSPLQGNG